MKNKSKKIIITCRTILPEVEKLLDDVHSDFEIIIMDSNLHDRPDKLRMEIQRQLDTLSGVELVLLPFGYCGGAVIGLKSHDFKLILPKVDDCITLFFGSRQKRNLVNEEERTFFLTKGWLDSERNLIKEYKRLSKKYGQRNADAVIHMMYHNYHQLALIDTGLFPLDGQWKLVKKTAKLLQINCVCCQGTDELLKQLLCGPYSNERFIIIQPHQKVEKSYYEK